jgi:hypothetical protein
VIGRVCSNCDGGRGIWDEDPGQAAEFGLKDCRDPVVLPYATNQGGVPFGALVHKAAGAVIDGQHALVDGEQGKPDGLATDPLPKVTITITITITITVTPQADGQGSPSVGVIETVEKDFTGMSAVHLDHSGAAMGWKLDDPSLGLGLGGLR